MLPPPASSRHAPRCRRRFGGRKHQRWLKPLSYFQFSSPSWLLERPPAISLIDISVSPCAREREGAPGRCVCAGSYWSTVPPSIAVAPPEEATKLPPTACGVSSVGSRAGPVLVLTDTSRGSDRFLRASVAGCTWCVLFCYFFLSPCTSHCPFSIYVVLHVVFGPFSSAGVWKEVASQSRNKSQIIHRCFQSASF